MATPAASAAKYDLAQRQQVAAMAQLSAMLGVAVPPPIGRMDDALARHAAEADRMARFLTAVAKQLQTQQQEISHA